MSSVAHDQFTRGEISWTIAISIYQNPVKVVELSIFYEKKKEPSSFFPPSSQHKPERTQ